MLIAIRQVIIEWILIRIITIMLLGKFYVTINIYLI